MKKINFVRNAVVVEGFVESPKPLFRSIVDGYFIKPTDTEKVLIKSVFSGYDKVFTNWCAFGTDPKKKPAKVPWNGLARRPASSDKRISWVDLDIALAIANSTKINGLGIFLNGTDLTVIDVDHIKKDGSSDDIEDIMDLDIVKFILNKFNSYTEISPSGKGLHIFLKGKVEIPEGFSSKKNGEFHYNGYTAQFEVFDGEKFHKSYNSRDLDKNKKTGSPRFMTISGLVIDEEHKQINPLNKDEFIEFAKECGNIYVDNNEPVSNEYKPTLVTDKDDTEIIRIINSTPRMLEFMNPDVIHFTNCAEADMVVRFNDTGYAVEDSNEGDTYRLEYDSPSEYDAALMGKIAFLTRNPDQMINVFKMSDYYKKFRSVRDKYKVSRKDYWNRTVEGALSWSNLHPEANPFMYLDYNYLTDKVHNKVLTDKEFVEYLIHKGILDQVKMLCVGKSDEDNQFIKYNKNIGCWDTQHRSVSAFTDVLYEEVDRLINIIEVKRAKDYEELQKKIAAVEAKGEKWEGATELPADPVYTYLTRLYNAKGINSLINVMKKLSSIQTFWEDYDDVNKCGDYLYFEDCKLDLNTGDWLDITPDDMNSKSCALKVKPYLNPDGTIKTDGTVQKYMHDFFIPTMGKNKGIYQKGFYKMFMSALGSSLYGYVKEKYFYFMYGEGNTGKSVLMDTIAAALGGDTDRGFYMPLDPSFFTAERGGNNDTLYHSKGRRFGVGSEMESVMKLKNDTVKYYTGNDNIRVSAKYMRQISFKMSLSNFIETNELPFISNGLDAAMCNRIAIISCEHVVNSKDQDKNLKKKLAADVGGLIWLLKTASDIYRSEGLVIPEEALTLKQEYVKELSTIEQFAQEFLVFTGDEADKIPSGELYEEYRRFYTNIEYGLGKQEKYIESENTFLKNLRKAARSRGVEMYSKQERDKTHPKGRTSYTYGVKFADVEIEEEIPEFFR